MSGILPWDSVVDVIKIGVDKIWPDKTEADRARTALEQAQLNGALKELENLWNNASEQLQVNAHEAENTNVFIAGWRPFIGWVCGFAFAWQFVLQPFCVFLSILFGHPIPSSELPSLDFSQIQPVLYGMLGLGAMRTVEKIKNATSSKNL